MPIFENQSQAHKSSVSCKRKGNIRTCLTGRVPQRSWKFSAGHDSVCYCWRFAGVKEKYTTWIKEQEESQTAAFTLWFRGLWNVPRTYVSWFQLQKAEGFFNLQGMQLHLPNKHTQETHLKSLSSPYSYLLFFSMTSESSSLQGWITKCIFYEKKVTWKRIFILANPKTKYNCVKIPPE